MNNSHFINVNLIYENVSDYSKLKLESDICFIKWFAICLLRIVNLAIAFKIGSYPQRLTTHAVSAGPLLREQRARCLWHCLQRGPCSVFPSIDQVLDRKQSASVSRAFCPVLERTGTIPGASGLKWSTCHLADCIIPGQWSWGHGRAPF